MQIERYNELKKIAEKEQAAANKAEGLLAGLKKQLAALGYKTVKEARAARDELKQQIAKLETELNEELEAFEKTYKDQLDD